MNNNYNLLTEEAISLLCQLIEIPSIHKQEQQVADFLQHFLEAKGMSSGRKGNNVWCLSPKFDLKKPTVLLTGHMDTEEPSHEWMKRPFVPKESNGKIYGLGSNDAGGALVCLLEVFLLMCQRSQPFNLVFLAACKGNLYEEGGCACVVNELPPVHLAIVGEPTNMKWAKAECGRVSLSVCMQTTLNEQCADSMTNAVYKALEDWEWCRNHPFDRVSPILGEMRVDVTDIVTGRCIQGVPQMCTYRIEAWTNECYEPEEVVKCMQEHLKGKVTVDRPVLKVSVLEDGHPAALRLKALGIENYGSRLLSTQAIWPFPSIKMGPGAPNRIGKPDEFIKLQEIEQGIKMYLDLLDGLELTMP